MVNGLRHPKGIPAMREWIEQTTGFLGGLFPTPLYHGSVFGELSRTAELAERPASMQACP